MLPDYSRYAEYAWRSYRILLAARTLYIYIYIYIQSLCNHNLYSRVRYIYILYTEKFLCSKSSWERLHLRLQTKVNYTWHALNALLWVCRHRPLSYMLKGTKHKFSNLRLHHLFFLKHAFKNFYETGPKIKWSQTLSRHFYFNRVTRLWNLLPPIDLDLPLASIKRNLKSEYSGSTSRITFHHRTTAHFIYYVRATNVNWLHLLYPSKLQRLLLVLSSMPSAPSFSTFQTPQQKLRSITCCAVKPLLLLQ